MPMQMTQMLLDTEQQCWQETTPVVALWFPFIDVICEGHDSYSTLITKVRYLFPL